MIHMLLRMCQHPMDANAKDEHSVTDLHESSSRWMALLLLLAVALAGGFFLAVTPHQRDRRSNRATAAVGWDSVVDDGTSKVVVSVLVPTAGDEGWIQQMLEARFHIEFKPQFVSLAAREYRKPLMLAGGDVPDFFAESDAIELQQDARNGLLMELPLEIIRRYASAYVEAVNSMTPSAWLRTNWRGKNYGLPMVYATHKLSAPGVWRADWLRKVGLTDADGNAAVPETLVEMHEALWRFTFLDPDGNGKQDTYGMSGEGGAIRWTAFADVFGAFGTSPFDWIERDGRVVWGGLLPETREALSTLRDWYREGIIDPDFVTDRFRESLQQKFLSGRMGYLYGVGRHHLVTPNLNTSLQSRIRKLNPAADLVCGRFPVGPHGDCGAPANMGAYLLVFGRQVATKPQKILRLLDMFEQITTNRQLLIASKLGQRGVHWEYKDPDIGPHSGVRFLPPFDEVHTASRAMLCPIAGVSIFSPCGPAAIVEEFTSRSELAFNQQYRQPEWSIDDALGSPDAVPSAGRYLADLCLMQARVFSEIIRGDRDLTAFDSFVAAWTARGGNKLTTEAEELLQEKRRIYSEMGINP